MKTKKMALSSIHRLTMSEHGVEVASISPIYNYLSFIIQYLERTHWTQIMH